MPQKKYVSLSKLETFLENLNAKFAAISHKHKLSDLTDYTVDTSLSSTSNNPVANSTLNAEFDAISDAMGALEISIDGKADTGHTHTYESIEGLEDAIGEVADSKFYVVTFDLGSDNKYHGDLTFAEIRKKFEAGGNMVARIDGTDYIPLLSAATHQIIFSGIYQSQSVALTINSSDVCTLTTTRLADSTSLSSHTTNTNNPHKVTCEQIGAATTNEVTNAIDTCKSYTDTTVTTLKNELLNGAGEAYDTLKELGDLIDTNVDAIEALEIVATGKADKSHTHDDMYYTESEVDEKLDVLNELIVQSDFEQNDSSAIDYIKNRTHWVQRAGVVLESESFACTTLATDTTDTYYCAKSGNIGLVSGNKYNVTVNGTVYTATALVAFGTDDIALIAEADKCRIYDRANGFVEVFTDSSTTLTISIEGAEDIYVKLDERFIPDVFARSTDVELKMDKENPTGTGSLSINRASGSEIGENSVAIGTDCIASGASAIAIGFGVSATGFASHAEGNGSVASGDLAHAEGQDSKATGYASHAESSGEANGNYSHAEGYGIADGDYSHASGNGTWAVGRSQTVIGEANLEDYAENAATRGTYAVIVGNGDIDAGEYSNAATLDWVGNAEFAGDIIAHGCSSEESPVSLVNVNASVQSLEEKVGDGFEDITEEEIRALFN